MHSLEEIDVDQLRRLAAQGPYMDIVLRRGAPGAPYDGPITLTMKDGEKIVMNAHVREEACLQRS